jgi:hypothetical protein
MAKAQMAAHVLFCGHDGFFLADIWKVGNVNVVRANGPVTPANVIRQNIGRATHRLLDFPEAGFWRPDLGVFVVPEKQVVKL